MKQLEIKTNKRLLIVEPNNESEYEDIINGDFRFICKGSYLTEGIAKGFLHQSIHTGLFAHYVKDIPVNTYCYKTALEAFDAVIYAYGYHWGENPLGIESEFVKTHLKEIGYKYNPGYKSWENGTTGIGTPLLITDLPPILEDKKMKWLEAESRTFNPSKCIIFEIV